MYDAKAHEALYNLWMPRGYDKWIQDFCDQQADTGLVGMITPQGGAHEDIVWSAAFVVMPWWQYVHCGDKRILENSYPAMKAYMDFLQKVGVKEVKHETTDYLVETLMSIGADRTRYSSGEDRGHLQISQWGDHLSTSDTFIARSNLPPQLNVFAVVEKSDTFIARSNLPLSIATAFYYLDVSTMAKIASVLGEEDDAKIYSNRADEINTAFNERFYNSAQGFYDTGIQSAQAWPIAFGLIPDEEKERVQNHFTRNVETVQRHLTTGYAGTKFAIEALSKIGRDDLVWKLATDTTYPSWGYMLRLNRTTSCERWDGEAGSLNHAPLGAAIDEWFYWGLAGIRPDAAEPGFRKIIFKPYLPEDLDSASASIETSYGTVSSSWKQKDGSAELTLKVPANCYAEVHIPCGESTKVIEGNVTASDSEGISLLESSEESSIFQITSGSYVFSFPV